jgi:hypothetical protein
VTVVAAPVLARLGPGWERRAAGRRRFEVGGFVVVVTPPGTPWLPNGIAPGPGPTRIWDPVLPALRPGAALARRGRDVLAALGPVALAPGGAAAPPASAVDALLHALRTGDPGRDAADGLLGRGAGLTPEGDDLLAGACAVGAASGSPLALPPDLRERTTALSATLLELASAGAAPRPLHTILDLSSRDWGRALTALVGLGASSGRAMALGAGAAAALIGARGRVAPRTARHYVA